MLAVYPPGELGRGYKLLDQKRFAEAFEVLEPIASAHPENKRLARKAYVAGLSRMLELYRSHRPAEVLALSDRVIAVQPDDYQAYFAQGRALEELKRVPESIESYRKAKERSSRDFVNRALANAYILAGDYPSALDQYEDIVSSGAVLKQRDLENMGLAAYKTGETDKAIQYLNKALAFSPGDAAIRMLLAKCTRESAVQGNYASSSNAHFDVLFENTPAQRELKEKLLGLLENAYQIVTTDLDTRPDNTVQVVIYPSPSAYREVSDAPSWSAAVYDGKIRIPTGETGISDDALQRILQHEFTHLLVEKLAGRQVPTWMNEGIAQVEEKREVPWAMPLLRRVLGTKTLRGAFMPLESLEGSFLGMSGDTARLAYAEAYYAVKYMLDMGGTWTFTSMLASFKDGTSVSDALQNATGYDYEQFQKKWVAHMTEEFHVSE